MCGLIGIWNLDGKPVDVRGLVRATHLLRHRGPDDEGYLLIHTEKHRIVPCGGEQTDPRLGLPRMEEFSAESFDLAFGFRRLAILDLSPTGHQPMGNDEGGLWVMLNGEIYNYLEMRQDLEGKGHTFRSQSDTETLLHGFEEYGESILHDLNGMFAFALWDQNRKNLFCARDRIGIKPLYYYRDPSTFLFASEIKGILAIRPELRSPNFPYLKDFLKTGRLDHSHFTLFDRIFQLPPAHLLHASLDSLQLQSYWDIEEQEIRERYDYLHPEESLRFLLQDAVRLQLRSDVPVGTCLSGGLDSTSVVALATSRSPGRFKSFSSVYQEEGYDEGRFVKIAASTFATNSYIVQPTPTGFLKTLRQITWHMDEPTAGPGVYSQWFVMREAGGKVKVLLDGQGGDELLAGYYYYFFPYFSSLWSRFVASKDLRYLARIAQDFLPIWRLVRRNFRFLGLQPFLRKLFIQVGDRIGTSVRPVAFASEFERATPSLAAEPRPSRLADPLNDRLYWDLARDSIPALLHYEDRNSMAFGIEARVPLLDHRVVEFCLCLSPELKISGDRTKLLLRRAMADLLPQPILDRQDKKGYPTPLALWLRGGLYQEVREYLLSSHRMQPAIFDQAKVAKLLEEHRRGKRDLSWEIFRWITCNLWFQLFFHGESSFGT